MNKHCPTCGGFGKVYSGMVHSGSISEYVACPDCDGTKTVTREEIIQLLLEIGEDYRKTLKEEK